MLGTVESIRGLERDDVWAYYRDRYIPNRMVLLLAGDFDPDVALERIGKYFGGGAASDREDLARRDASAGFPIRLARRRAWFTTTSRPVAPTCAPLPRTEPGRNPDASAFGLMAGIVSGSASPLEQTLKGGENPAVFEYSLGYETTGGAGILGFSAALTGAKTPEQVLGMTAEAIVRTVHERTIDPVELRVLHQERLTEDATLAEQVHYYAMFRAPRLLQSTVADLAAEAARRDAVDVGTFSRLVDRYLDPPRAVVTVSGPDEQSGVETTVEWPAIHVDSAKAKAAADSGAAAPEVVVLGNGLTLSVRTDTNEKVFAAHLIARNRSALEPEDRAGLADLVHRLLLRAVSRGAPRRSTRSFGGSVRT